MQKNIINVNQQNSNDDMKKKNAASTESNKQSANGEHKQIFIKSLHYRNRYSKRIILIGELAEPVYVNELNKFAADFVWTTPNKNCGLKTNKTKNEHHEISMTNIMKFQKSNK